MSFTFDSDTKERVRAATDIVDLIGSKLELRRQGRNYVALCPWHRDSRPSLQINTEKQIWKCWVCDIGGDVFTFLMQDEGIAFGEALKRLADAAGIPLSPARGKASGKLGNPDIKAEIYRALAWADELYQRLLLDSREGESARDYLQQRGISKSMVKHFGVGLSPNSWSALLDEAPKHKITTHVLESAGLAGKKEHGGFYDFFRGRVMFPIRDRDKRVIAFGGRVLPGQEGAKYINSRETRLFQKNKQLYGFDLASSAIRKSKQAIVMEGYTDVIFAHQSGIDNAVAVLGTALGNAHLKLLRHYCDSVVLLLDGDEAGQKRSDEVLELFLHAQMDVRVLSLPNGMDPADYLKEFGKENLQQLIAGAVDALEFKMRRVTSGIDPLLDTHRANQAVEEMLGLLAKVPHSGLVSNESFRLRQNQVLPRLARKFSLAEDALRERLKRLGLEPEEAEMDRIFSAFKRLADRKQEVYDSDLEALARETHKFESRYLDGLVGKLPEDKAIYDARSPIKHIDQLETPMLFLQRLEDKVVPPNQSELMFIELRNKEIPTAYVAYEGEGHGFRQADNIINAIESELSFYGKIFGFAPAGNLPEITIENLHA